ncbi:MAG: hypothetical protein HY720_11895, partial [Planctomycetes bacterium]|nr:hypothetical protein [Planctomycetota bacterium]
MNDPALELEVRRLIAATRAFLASQAAGGREGGSGGEALPPGRQEGRGEAEGAKPPRGGAE